MRLRAVAPHAPAAMRDALRHRGWDAVRAEAAAGGLTPQIVTADGLAPEEVEALVTTAARAGLDCLTGDSWAIVAGGRARLAALARPGEPGPLGRIGPALGSLLGAAERERWTVRGRSLPLAEPLLVGIVNVTPDSFSDGGRFLDTGAALEHAERLVAEGAHVLDVGAESTRPGRAAAVPAEEEQQRLLPVVAGIVRRCPAAVVSVDTVNSGTAERALGAGAHAVNDVTALRHDPAVARVCAETGAGLVLMHSRGALLEIADYVHATYGPDPAAEVADELAQAAAAARQAGVADEAIVLDPGLGFAKRPEHNWQVLNRLETVTNLGYPVLIGPSRKRFLGEATQRPVEDRDVATAVACALGWMRGARLFRVHHVGHAQIALAVARTWREA